MSLSTLLRHAGSSSGGGEGSSRSNGADGSNSNEDSDSGPTIYLFVHLPVYPSTYPSILLYIYLYPSIRLVYQYIKLSNRSVSNNLSILSVYLSISLSIYLSIYLYNLIILNIARVGRSSSDLVEGTVKEERQDDTQDPIPLLKSKVRIRVIPDTYFARYPPA